MKIGLACAGGGIEGAVYEIGALCALEDAIIGFNTLDLDVYVGVSAGALISSNLVNGISPREMSLAILSRLDGVNPITPEVLYKPNFKEIKSQLWKLPKKFIEVVSAYATDYKSNSLFSSLSEFASLLPNGIFDNTPLEEYLRTMFEQPGKTNQFKDLKKVLRIVAVDLDSGKTVRFGDETLNTVPISKAVQASTALPGIYAPVEIQNKFYIDGVARRTIHASVALNEGAKLVFGVNPIVPLENQEDDNRITTLADTGLVTTLSQTFRLMIHSRMKIGINAYKTKYPDADLVIFEPSKTDHRMFFNNILSFSTRKEVCEHAYHLTLCDIKNRREELTPILKKHGLSLNETLLQNDEFILYQKKPETTFSKMDSAISRLENLIDTI